MSFSILFLSDMKRLLILFVVIVTALSLLALPIAADEASDADAPKETTSVSNENGNAGNKNKNENATLTDVFNSINDIAKYFKEPTRIFEFIVIDISKLEDKTFFVTLLNGGYNYFSGKNNPINLMISTLYNITYPIGIIAMILAWIFGIIKSSTNTALDIKDKNSLIRSMLGLVIGLAAMTAAPYVLTILTSISNWLCVRISSISIDTWMNEIIYDGAIQEMFNQNGGYVNFYELHKHIKSVADNTESQIFYGIIVTLIIEFVFCLNMLWLALLQVVSPIFIGLCASGIARKFTFNFIKEYFKALLMPALSLIYTTLCIAMLGTENLNVINSSNGVISILPFIVALVLSISTLGIAGKKLDKLIN